MYSQELVINILKFLEANLNQKISMEKLAKTFNYDKAYIMRTFKKEMGVTIIDYLNRMKIYKAINLLKNSKISLLSIALQSGFYNQEYFSETFKKIMGITPHDYRNFLLRKSNFSRYSKETIINKTISLINLKEKSHYYIKNKKPTNPVKVKKL